MRPQSRLQRLRSSARFLALTSNVITKQSLKALTEPILRPFRISPVDNVEFPRGTSVLLTWIISLIKHYTSENEESDAYRRRMGALTVKELHWYKGSNGVEHEYVIAIVTDPQYGLNRFLRLERARDDSSEDVLSYRTVDSLRRYATSEDSSSSFHSSTYSLHQNASGSCLDTVRVLTKLPESDKLLERSTFWSPQPAYHAPTILDLALAVKAVHENNNYKHWPRQCVWFSSMIVHTLQSDFQHQITHRDSSLTFQSWTIEMLDEGIGTLKARAIHKEQTQVTNDIVAAFRSNRAHVLQKIENAAKRDMRHKEQDDIIGEAAQREEAGAITTNAAESSVEARVRAMEAAARVIEAEARAAQETRLREEAEQRARDEAQRNAISEREVEDLKRRIVELEVSKSSRSRAISWYR
ncbi:hypothetical protein Hypma_002771 [Hypsizygus marmoreus]|uniref:Uncharacterized protein n=1 Tax=Hypsizygus marmoreus TaxID=39966 RepID=A0A369JC25_HYPMA|nr:hypothetical protein Hypma_002771 [Hypsizygus marmoreus]